MALIKNRQILFSNREQYLGTTYDHSSNHMVFRTGRINDDGMDLADMTFNVVLKYSDTNATDTDTATLDVSDQYIDIIWTIASSVMTHEGTNLIQLQAFDESGTFKWSTFQEVIYIENALTNVPSSASLSALETLESRIASVVSSESSRVTAEAARVTAETARASAESSRVTAENARVTAETARTTAEASRVSTFTSNETSRANTFTASEASRASTFTANEASRDARVTVLETGYTATSLLAKSYAVGGTGTRAGEDTDNAKYYKEQAQSTSVGSLKYEEEKIHFGDTDSTTDGGDVTSIVAQDTNGVAKAYTVKDSEARTSALNAQDAADAAQSTANTAASNASAAQSTANTAVSNAAAAQSTANTAVSNAAAAQSTANTAASNAATAQSTANTAVSNAAAAQSTANTAASNAATAQTTADNAQTAADARVKYTDALTLEEIAASTDLTNKVAGAGAVKSLNQSLAEISDYTETSLTSISAMVNATPNNSIRHYYVTGTAILTDYNNSAYSSAYVTCTVYKFNAAVSNIVIFGGYCSNTGTPINYTVAYINGVLYWKL